MPATMTHRLQVDAEKCQGHNRCKSIAPELFTLDVYGHASPAGDGVVPPHQLDRALLAQSNCPEFAVRLVSA